MELIDEARDRAVEVLQQCATPLGFKASALEHGYPHVWARDSVITSLGASLAGPEFIGVLRASLDTLSGHQSELGLIPLNVHSATGEVSTENAGALDANLWFVLGHFGHFSLTGDLAYLCQNWGGIHKAVLWLRYQDMNECGLLEVPEAGNWMDLMAVRYNTLYDNVLYYAALRAFDAMATALEADREEADRPVYPWPCSPPAVGPCNPAGLAEAVKTRLNLLLWIERCWVAQHFAEHLERLKQMRLEWYMLYHNVGEISSRPYYLPWVAFREYGDYCDVLGNLLAILFGVADEARSDTILRYMYQVGIGCPYPSKAINPPIYPGQPDWREYYRSRNLNLPHQYHNGGIWPFIGGFHIAALVKMGRRHDAESLLNDLARACRLGVRQEWEFNEWLHGETGNPMGFGYQAWSAGMYVYAYEAVRTGRLPVFEALTAGDRPATAEDG